MKFLLLLNVFVAGTFALGSDSVCYSDLGCFEKGKPFYDLPDRPISYLPDSREDVRTRFFLNTRSNPTSYDTLSTADLSTITSSHFDPARETKFISHGYMENGLVGWMEDMMTEFLNNGDYNVIRVDWGKGSTATYGQATANTRIVGAEISFLLDKLKELYGYTADKGHIIGHSLGSHVAGYAGERQKKPKLGRITGMDPAGPYFEDTDIIVRLDPSDATFVDAIHTDTDPIYSIGYGIFMQVGHMDFYINGGTDQPGCDQGLVGNIITSGGIYDGGVQYVACNHVRSYEYFTESINSRCKFTSYDCTKYGQGKKGYEAYRNGQCYDNNGVEMGFHSIDSWSMSSASDTVYFVNTKDSSPYCGLQYRFQMYVDDPGWLSGSKEKGDLFVYLVGTRGQTERMPLTTHSQYFEPNKDDGFVGVAGTDPGRLTGMYMEWSYDPDWYKPWDWDVWTNPEIYVHKFDVESSEEKRG